MPPAARIADLTAHGTPLVPGPGSLNVLIGGRPAWRAASPAAVAGFMATIQRGLDNIAKASAANTAAAGTPGAPAAQANLTKAGADAVADAAAAMAALATDTIVCPMLTVLIPHGPGVAIVGSTTVLINGLPACRIGDTIQEATLTNVIAQGLPTVIIGG